MALIDFSRASDRVWHTGLLHKLIQLGAPPCLVRSIKAVLANQQSRVRFEGKTSRHLKFTGGVPQGGVLSPTLFLIFINDISTNLPEGTEISLFADDLALLVQHENLDEAASLLQQGLQCVEDWSLQWKMTLNVEKYEVTHFLVDKRSDLATHRQTPRPKPVIRRIPNILGGCL
ncbi:RNA-directed DNA polymerase from mobile element jockey [Elysia marginata]|uniref:RNA-directed DNA polymerase from mobile element jockey n=1 Tax=Elysia marginata TaxID=1093978 RepID=A0AAV4GPX2_9GAST|nr:RNA-directed DNA polymerase from mobile element jockey [Elysia marginata]